MSKQCESVSPLVSALLRHFLSIARPASRERRMMGRYSKWTSRLGPLCFGAAEEGPLTPFRPCPRHVTHHQTQPIKKGCFTHVDKVTGSFWRTNTSLFLFLPLGAATTGPSLHSPPSQTNQSLPPAARSPWPGPHPAGRQHQGPGTWDHGPGTRNRELGTRDKKPGTRNQGLGIRNRN